MDTGILKYSKLKDHNDVDFITTYFKKNDLEKFRCQIFEELRSEKVRNVSEFTGCIKEYCACIKLEKEITDLSEQHSATKLTHSRLQEILESLKEDKENKLRKDVQRKVFMYENNLAMKIEPTSNTTGNETAILFSFYNIDENSPEKTCTFVLTILDSEIYKATDCHPPITEMDRLISQLNKTNDLHQFIVDLRKKMYESLAARKYI